ncbi:hypothetical protein WHR41_05160 [Cladosporium halotolerans]|uniref:Nuclear pore complex component n=1 Tax=Cladosporium halotolerans TaxID=1052096 RepID=A0AB34KN57_9PEZI
MASTSLTQSTSGSSSSSLTRSGTPYAQSPASKIKNVAARPISNLTLQKSPATPSGTPYAQSPASKIKNVAAHPISNLTPQKSPATPSGTPNGSPAIIMTPGRWQHPRMDEIVRRQNASCFNPGDARIVVLNLVVIVLTLKAQPYISSIPIQLVRNTPYASWTLHTLRLGLLVNMAVTLAPLFRRPDACEDIPLTPQQRHALGLPPMSRPATPQEQAQYVTPPKYSRSATPRSINSTGSFADSMRVQARASPLSGRGSPLDASISSPFGSARRASGSGSPFSASPLKDKMLANNPDMGRRGSFGSSRGSPLGGDFDGLSSSSGKTGRASVGLNSKWLYQKGRASPGLTGTGWGTGSVFN